MRDSIFLVTSLLTGHLIHLSVAVMLFVLVLLLVFQTSRTERTNAKNSDPPVFILQDVADGKCLSGATFKRCALDTLWFVSGKPGSYQIKRKNTGNSLDDESYCLSKEVCDQDNSTVGVFPCDYCAKHKWNVLGEAQTGIVSLILEICELIGMMTRLCIN